MTHRSEVNCLVSQQHKLAARVTFRPGFHKTSLPSRQACGEVSLWISDLKNFIVNTDTAVWNA